MSDLRSPPIHLYIVLFVKNIFAEKSWKALKRDFCTNGWSGSLHLATTNLIVSCKPTLCAPWIVTGERQKSPVNKLIHPTYTPDSVRGIRYSC